MAWRPVSRCGAVLSSAWRGHDTVSLLLRHFGSVSSRQDRERMGIQVHKQASQAVSESMRSVESNAPEKKIITAKIKEAGNRRDWPSVEKILGEVVEMNTILYNVSMAASIKCGKAHAGLRLYEDLCRSGCQKTMASYTPAIRICGMLKNYGRASEIWGELAAHGIPHDQEEVAFISIMAAAADVGDVQECLRHLAEMKKRNVVPPPLHVFNCVLNACRVATDHENAALALDDMRTHGLRPDVIAYATAMGAHALATTSAIAALEADMTKDGVVPNAFLAEAHLAALANMRVGQWSDPAVLEKIRDVAESELLRFVALGNALNRWHGEGLASSRLSGRIHAAYAHVYQAKYAS